MCTLQTIVDKITTMYIKDNTLNARRLQLTSQEVTSSSEIESFGACIRIFPVLLSLSYTIVMWHAVAALMVH